MKKLTLIPAILLFSLVVSAQGPDFSGNWKLNSEKSKLNAEFSLAPKTMEVDHKEVNMTVVKHSSFQDQEFTTTDKLILDGTECINPGIMDTQKKSTATWSSDKSSLKIISKIPMQDGSEIVITEVYKLAEGSLIIESSASSSYGDMSETMVYDKK
jgi:hypothetical protein